MTSWEYLERDVLTWRLPLLGTSEPSDLPSHWLQAVAAVGRDLAFRRVGRRIRLDDETVCWELSLSVGGDDYYVGVGMCSLAAGSGFGDFSVGQGYTLETTLAQATVWVAEVLQDDLAGYEFVQWPSDGGPLFVPEIYEQRAVWINPATGAAVSPIGALTD